MLPTAGNVKPNLVARACDPLWEEWWGSGKKPIFPEPHDSSHRGSQALATRLCEAKLDE